MNEHVHPLIAGILHTFTARPRAANDPLVQVFKRLVPISDADLHETFAGLARPGQRTSSANVGRLA